MRTLKPGFFTNDLLAEIKPLGRLLFAGLWTIADREGRLEDRAKKIKAEILPYDNCDVNNLLAELERFGFILRYKIEEARFIQILNFTKHQSPHIKEPPSIIPPPTQLEQQDDLPVEPDEAKEPGAPAKSGASTVQSPVEPRRSGFMGSGIQEQEQEWGVGSGHTGPPARAPDLPVGLLDHPATIAYWRQFKPERLPAIGAQERAVREVKDFRLWQSVLDFWRDNGHRAESFGRMVDCYLEGGPRPPNGGRPGGQNGDRKGHAKPKAGKYKHRR